MSVDTAPVTQWLGDAAAGDAEAWEQVAAWAYAELERLAARRMRRAFGGRDVTLEPAALVNESFVKLLHHPAAFENRRHFFSFVGKIMLRVLIDYQRLRLAGKRRFQNVRLTVDGIASSGRASEVDVLALDQALGRLEALDPRKAEVAKLRTLWGMTMDEIAEVLEVSQPTVRRDWRFTRSWLAQELELPL